MVHMPIFLATNANGNLFAWNILLFTLFYFSLIPSLTSANPVSCASRDVGDIEFIYVIGGGCTLILQWNNDVFLKETRIEHNSSHHRCSPSAQHQKPLTFVQTKKGQKYLHVIYKGEDQGLRLVSVDIAAQRESRSESGFNEIDLDKVDGSTVDSDHQLFETCHINVTDSLLCYRKDSSSSTLQIIEVAFKRNKDVYSPIQSIILNVPSESIAEHVWMSSFVNHGGQSKLLLPHVLKWVVLIDRDEPTTFKVINVPTIISPGSSDEQFPLILSSFDRGLVSALCENVGKMENCTYQYTDMETGRLPVCFSHSSTLSTWGVISKRYRSDIMPLAATELDEENSIVAADNSTIITKDAGNVNVNTFVHVYPSGSARNSTKQPIGFLSDGVIWFLPIFFLLFLILLCVLFFAICALRERKRETVTVTGCPQPVQPVQPPVQQHHPEPRITHQCEVTKRDIQQVINTIEDAARKQERQQQEQQQRPLPPPPPQCTRSHLDEQPQPPPIGWIRDPRMAYKSSSAYDSAGPTTQLESAPPVTVEKPKEKKTSKQKPIKERVKRRAPEVQIDKTPEDISPVQKNSSATASQTTLSTVVYGKSGNPTGTTMAATPISSTYTSTGCTSCTSDDDPTIAVNVNLYESKSKKQQTHQKEKPNIKVDVNNTPQRNNEEKRKSPQNENFTPQKPQLADKSAKRTSSEQQPVVAKKKSSDGNRFPIEYRTVPPTRLSTVSKPNNQHPHRTQPTLPERKTGRSLEDMKFQDPLLRTPQSNIDREGRRIKDVQPEQRAPARGSSRETVGVYGHVDEGRGNSGRYRETPEKFMLGSKF